jgi:hypothetical protein
MCADLCTACVKCSHAADPSAVSDLWNYLLTGHDKHSLRWHGLGRRLCQLQCLGQLRLFWVAAQPSREYGNTVKFKGFSLCYLI